MMSVTDPQPAVSRDALPALFVQRPAHPEQARAIRHAVAQFVQELGCPSSLADAVTLAVGEALNNAVSYGQETAGAAVSLDCRFLLPGVLTIEVRNPGTGFLPDLATACALPDDFAVHGRGFALMSMLMDEVQVFADGEETVVRLVKRLTA